MVAVPLVPVTADKLSAVAQERPLSRLADTCKSFASGPLLHLFQCAFVVLLAQRERCEVSLLLAANHALLNRYPQNMFASRIEQARAQMANVGVDVLLLSVGADLPYLTGYEAMPLERLTMLVVPSDGPAELIIPGLEAPRVDAHDDVFTLVPWGETDDPIQLAIDRIGSRTSVAIGEKTWATFLVQLVARLDGVTFRDAGDVMTPLRSVKDAAEIANLRSAAEAVDRIAARLQSGQIDLVGRTEAQVSAELGRQIVAEGHHRVNFAIVAAGENASSPHHEPGERVIQPNEVVLCDFGGTMINDGNVGCSDITRCVYTGEPPAEFAELYDVLFAAQEASVAAATVGTPAQEVDRVGRAVIDDAGYGEYFIHRTGHGIGVEAHEHPYIVEGNADPLAVGHAFSVEPGIYVPGKWGARLEDIVVAAADGPDPLNRVDHHLAVIS